MAARVVPGSDAACGAAGGGTFQSQFRPARRASDGLGVILAILCCPAWSAANHLPDEEDDGHVEFVTVLASEATLVRRRRTSRCRRVSPRPPQPVPQFDSAPHRSRRTGQSLQRRQLPAFSRTVTTAL